jgi:hypothetical protein
MLQKIGGSRRQFGMPSELIWFPVPIGLLPGSVTPAVDGVQVPVLFLAAAWI